MFDPFDSSSIQSAYGGTRFTGGQGEEQDAMADFADSYMQGAMGIEAATRSGKLRAKAAKRAARYRKEQAQVQMDFQREMAQDARRAARPSSGQRIASGIGTAASAVGAIGSAVGIAAAI
jgi:acyl dehydratase